MPVSCVVLISQWYVFPSIVSAKFFFFFVSRVSFHCWRSMLPSVECLVFPCFENSLCFLLLRMSRVSLFWEYPVFPSFEIAPSFLLLRMPCVSFFWECPVSLFRECTVFHSFENALCFFLFPDLAVFYCSLCLVFPSVVNTMCIFVFSLFTVSLHYQWCTYYQWCMFPPIASAWCNLDSARCFHLLSVISVSFCCQGSAFSSSALYFDIFLMLSVSFS